MKENTNLENYYNNQFLTFQQPTHNVYNIDDKEKCHLECVSNSIAPIACYLARFFLCPICHIYYNIPVRLLSVFLFDILHPSICLRNDQDQLAFVNYLAHIMNLPSIFDPSRFSTSISTNLQGVTYVWMGWQEKTWILLLFYKSNQVQPLVFQTLSLEVTLLRKVLLTDLKFPKRNNFNH